MPRKTTKKPKRTVRRRTTSKPRTTRAKAKNSVMEVSSAPKMDTGVKSVTSKKADTSAHYMGYHYETWINIILVVSVILIIGILAGVGVLVQKANVQSGVPQFSAANSSASMTQGIGLSAARAKAKQVLDIIAGGSNYNITGIYEDHGVYRINLKVKTPTGYENGTAFMSLDGQQMYFRYLDVNPFLQQYANRTVNTTA